MRVSSFYKVGHCTPIGDLHLMVVSGSYSPGGVFNQPACISVENFTVVASVFNKCIVQYVD